MREPWRCLNTVLSDVSKFGLHSCRVSKIVASIKKNRLLVTGTSEREGHGVQFGRMKCAGDEWCAVSLGCTLKKIKIGVLYYVFYQFFFLRETMGYVYWGKGEPISSKESKTTCKQPEMMGRSYHTAQGLRLLAPTVMLSQWTRTTFSSFASWRLQL